MCLKACQRKLQEQAAFVFIEGRGPKTDKKPLAFVGSMSAVASSNFHHRIAPFVCG